MEWTREPRVAARTKDSTPCRGASPNKLRIREVPPVRTRNYDPLDSAIVNRPNCGFPAVPIRSTPLTHVRRVVWTSGSLRGSPCRPTAPCRAAFASICARPPGVASMRCGGHAPECKLRIREAVPVWTRNFSRNCALTSLPSACRLFFPRSLTPFLFDSGVGLRIREAVLVRTRNPSPALRPWG